MSYFRQISTYLRCGHLEDIWQEKAYSRIDNGLFSKEALARIRVVAH